MFNLCFQKVGVDELASSGNNASTTESLKEPALEESGESAAPVTADENVTEANTSATENGDVHENATGENTEGIRANEDRVTATDHLSLYEVSE